MKPPLLRLIPIIVAAFLTVCYVLVVVHFGYAARVGEILFWYPDTGTYVSVADWIAQGTPTADTLNRPFLYPLLVLLSRSVAGIRGIWISQVLLWLASGILLYCSLYRLCARLWVALAGVAVFAANLTLLLLTFHVLTETLTLFLLCVGLMAVACRQRMGEAVFRSCLLADSALLTVTKPVFLGLFFPALVFALLGFKHPTTRKALIGLGGMILLAASPVLVQVGIMKTQHNSFAISRIGYFTVNRYAFAALYGGLNHLPLEPAREAVKQYSTSQMLTYALRRPGPAFQVWRRLLRVNLTAGSATTDLPRRQRLLSRLMKRMNSIYYHLHIAMILPVVLCLLLAWMKEKYDLLSKLMMLLIPVLLVFATSGLSFRQADRLVAPVLPVWLTLYALVLTVLIRWTRAVNFESIPGASGQGRSVQ